MSKFDEGIYQLKIINQGFGESKNKKTPFFFLACEPEGMLRTDGTLEPAPEYGAELIWYITNNTVDRVLDDLESIGFVGRKFANLDPLSPNYCSLIGKRIEAECYHEQGTGDNSHKTFDRWRLPFKGREALENDGTVSRKLDTMFKDSFKGRAAPAAAKTEKVSSTSDDGEDIPF